MMKTISISREIYDILSQRAQESNRSPDELADELLALQLLPPHPYIEVYLSRSGPRAVIKGTRVGVSTIIGYIRMGYSPEAIATEILPHLTLAQIYDALSYYHEHKAEIDKELSEDSEDIWRDRLREMMDSEADFALITGTRV